MQDLDTGRPLIYSTLSEDPDLAELVELFVDEMPERIERLVHEAASGDLVKLGRTAHQIKGAAGSYGFHEFTPCAQRLETLLHESGPEAEIQAALDELIGLCRRARPGLPG